MAEAFATSREAAKLSEQLKRVDEEFALRNEKLQESNRLVTAEAAARKRAEEELQAANVELQRSNRELDLFASVISHDLQAPLRTLASYAELLQQKYLGSLDQRAAKYLHYVVDGAARMRTMINDLLLYSRVARKASPLVPVHMGTVLEQVLASLGSALAQSEAVVVREELPEVLGDPTLLAQLMQNLLENAITFRRKGVPVRIVISCQGGENEWLFGVSDNGIGIDPRFSERIFEVFQRLHTREEYEGSGIGLAICRKIVERHGGRIWVESSPGNGATFRFTMPLRGRHGGG